MLSGEWKSRHRDRTEEIVTFIVGSGTQGNIDNGSNYVLIGWLVG